jgi:hypothetical protein
VRDDDIPPWSNEEAQLEYIYNQIEGWPLMRPYRSEEERAVEAALRGEPEQLADLVCQSNPQQLAPDTRTLAHELMTGKRNPRTGRPEGEAGRPPMSEEQLRESRAVHEATEQFFIIREVLERDYPQQSKADIRDRALLLAEELTGVAQETIKNYRDLPKKRRRLPYRVLGYEEE